MTPSVLDLEKLVAHKKARYYPSLIKFNKTIPPDTTIKEIMKVPSESVYIVVREVHDVIDGVFTHKCEKDGDLVIPESVVTGDMMTIEHGEPLIVNNIWERVITNTDATTPHDYRLTIYILVCPARSFERELF